MMCCLFGIIDYKNSLTAKQKNRLLSALATAAEARGTDATGIAYNSDHQLRVYKRPWPGHCMRFRVPSDAAVVMGHTRMTTQGDARKNYNNHPFYSSVGGTSFALAHNGVLFNDTLLRLAYDLPRTKIETDSLVAVQLIEQQKTLDFASLKFMAEQVEGSFSFTVLSQDNDLYIVKGDSPLTVYHFPKMGLYVYASTTEILRRGLTQVRFIQEPPKEVPVFCGEILKINRVGKIARSRFDDSKLAYFRYDPMFRFTTSGRSAKKNRETDTYLREIKNVATWFGYAPEIIDHLAAQGFTPEELEEFLYCGDLFL